MNDHELLTRLDHLHRMLHSVLDGQADILDAIADRAASGDDAQKLVDLRDKVTAKTAALKAALAAAPAPK